MSIVCNQQTNRIEALAISYYNRYISNSISYRDFEIYYTDNLGLDYPNYINRYIQQLMI